MLLRKVAKRKSAKWPGLVYILGTAELIVLKFVTWAETDMICGLDKAMGVSVHVRTAHVRTPPLFLEFLLE